MDNLIKKIQDRPLSTVEIDKITNRTAKVTLFHTIKSMKSVQELFFEFNYHILFYAVEGSDLGHFVGLLYHQDRNIVEYFDSYGESMDTIFDSATYEFERCKGVNYLKELLIKDQARYGYKIEQNSVQYQNTRQSTATCGRHACVRIAFQFLNLEQYSKLLLGEKLKPDEIVGYLTLLDSTEDADLMDLMKNQLESSKK
jgi:hypothetical protein